MKVRYGACQSSARPRGAFTLIELLTVVAIISLLIGILLPSLTSARDQAKKVKGKALLKAIETGLELFKNENEREFSQSNGYPPSAGYNPAVFQMAATAARKDLHESDPPPAYTMNGAHWLARMLLGKDSQGFVRRTDVPDVPSGSTTLKNLPAEWYKKSPLGTLETMQRVGPYITPDSIQTMAVISNDPTVPQLSYTNAPSNMPPGLVDNTALVLTDVFERPILYYVANPFAARNGAIATEDDTLGIYDFRDNEGFTGTGGDSGTTGLDFGGGKHKINQLGDPMSPDDPDKLNSFVHYIHNHSIEGSSSDPVIAPYNKQTFLLITAGKDGVYGNQDDVTNFERLQ